MGSYRLLESAIEIKPGPTPITARSPLPSAFSGGKVDSITSKAGELAAYELEPQMITSLFEAEQRSKRQLVNYNEIPKVMVDAVLSIEDRRFFQHGGVNFIRFAEAHGSTSPTDGTSRAARPSPCSFPARFFLTPEKTIKRKLIGDADRMELEQKFSKQQIFEFYANRVDLGQRGSFTISGFAAGVAAYFNKDLKDVTLPEAALLAGIIQAPSYLSPYRHPERALNAAIWCSTAWWKPTPSPESRAEKAKATPLKLAPPNVEASDAPYFVDLVRDTVISKLNEREMNDQAYRIYTTLDPDLQKAAARAVETGMKLVDDQVTKLRTKTHQDRQRTSMKPKYCRGRRRRSRWSRWIRTPGRCWRWWAAEITACSQLNHAVAKRPTGSIFKPFVYAAAMNTALDGTQSGVYARVDGHRRAQHFRLRRSDLRAAQLQRGISRRRDRPLRPGHVAEQRHRKACGRSGLRQGGGPGEGCRHRFRESHSGHGTGRLRRHAAGHGSRLHRLRQWRDAHFADRGELGAQRQWRRRDRISNPRTRQVLDPRVAYVMTNMMEGVMNNGTAIRRSAARLHRSSGRKNWQLA